MQIVREVTTIASVAMPVGERWGVRRCRYQCEGGGGRRLCLSTGMHGDETMGQLVAYGVAARIKREPQSLAGTVDIYPMLNPMGLDIGERMVPSTTRLDMNRAFPGSPDGTVLESICYRVLGDMRGADLVLDLHASTHFKSELYEVRINARDAGRLLSKARSLCPELIWVLPDRSDFDASLTGALSVLGTDAMMLECDERRRRPQDIADRVVDGIFCKLAELGIWTGETVLPPAGEIPTVRSQQDILRVSCLSPGMYVPVDHIGRWVPEGTLLGTVIDALNGEAREEVRADASGLVFSQRSYSSVYPGTLIARLCRKERP